MSAAKTVPTTNGSNFETVAEKGFSNGVCLPKESAQKKKMRCALSDRAARVLEIAILTTVIICVMAFLSLPSALYYANQVSVASIRRNNTNISAKQ